mgnify:CR=1 FL=1
MRNIILVLLLMLFSSNSYSSNVLAQCTLLENINGYTPILASDKIESFKWLAFSDGRVLATGTNSTNDFENCAKIDGAGRTVLPGLIDAHGHIAALGNEMQRVKLRGVESESMAVSIIKDFADKNSDSPWVLGRGWNQVLWLDGSMPTKKTLDTLGIDRPVVLNRIDDHAIWVNSKALALAGIKKSTPDPEGGKIVRDSFGEATGILIDTAMALVAQKIPPPSLMEREAALDKAFTHLLTMGIVSVHDAGVNQNGLDAYKERNKNGELPIRVYAMLDGSSAKINQWLKAGTSEDDNDFLSIRSVKIYADGALGSRGAALLKPYSDDVDNKGLLILKTRDLEKSVQNILAKGFQVNVHAIGDRANRLVLDSIEKAFTNVGGRNLRNRIEHAQVVSLEDIPRFKKLDLIASMQPLHATSDKNMAGDRLGKQRLKGAYAWQKFIQQGTVVASGSDFPVELSNVFHGLHAAVTRQDQNNHPPAGWLPSERLTPQQALRSFTLDAAFAAHQEANLGSLEKGKWADFILVDQDIINGDPKNIWKTQVLETWIAGELRFKQ